MRRLGIGPQGGAEALAIFQQLIYDERASETLKTFMEWLNGVLCVKRQVLPKHAAVAVWKQCALSFVEQDGLPPMPEDRGAEQGDVELRPDCTLPPNKPHASSLGLVRTTQWKNSGLKLNTKARRSRFRTFDWVVQKNILEQTTRDLQNNGGLADLWYIDDGNILCHPVLVLSYL